MILSNWYMVQILTVTGVCDGRCMTRKNSQLHCVKEYTSGVERRSRQRGVRKTKEEWQFWEWWNYVYIDLFQLPTNAQFIYSIIIYVTLQSSTCFEQYSAHLQEVRLYYYSIWYRHSVSSYSVHRLRADSVRCQPVHWMEHDDTRCCNNTIWPPEDEHGIARNMSRIIM